MLSGFELKPVACARLIQARAWAPGLGIRACV